MLRNLSFKNPRRGKQPRAHLLLRLYRQARRKRVAWARGAAAENLRIAQRSVDRFHKLAAKHDVPVEQTAPLPVLPTLPGQDWVEYRRSMGDLRPPVKPAPPVEGVPA